MARAYSYSPGARTGDTMVQSWLATYSDVQRHMHNGKPLVNYRYTVAASDGQRRTCRLKQKKNKDIIAEIRATANANFNARLASV